MSGLIELLGRDLVVALVTGGFRVSRRERGLALLVRDYDAVVVPEHKTLDRQRILAVLDRAGIRESDLLSWMSAAATSTRHIPSRSGFHRRTGEEEARAKRTIEDVVRGANDARARADAAHVDARAVLVASQRFRETLRPSSAPTDDDRARAARESLARWQEALRQVEEEENRERRARNR